jgi:hypothetical protein
MALIREILNVTATTTADIEGESFTCQHQYDEAGAVQYTADGGSASEIILEGRLSPNIGWGEIATSGSLSSGDDVLQTGVAILPYMRARVSSPSVDAELHVYLMD